jgi:hypothetical protein
MPAVAPYIPPKDANYDTWFNNFSTLITAAPSTYGLLASDAATIAAQFSTWHAAYLLVTSPTTKTKDTVSAKNTAKINSLNVVRPYAQNISNNPGVTSANKIALGVNPKTSTPSPITPPNSYPVLTLISQNPGVINLSYRDSQTSPSVKSKPYGVKSMQLYGAMSATPITDPSLLNQLGTFTKSPLQYALPVGYTPGSRWYFAAKWQIQKGGQGPWSPITTLIVT